MSFTKIPVVLQSLSLKESLLFFGSSCLKFELIYSCLAFCRNLLFLIIEHHAEDEKYVELDYELLAVLANVTEGAARSTVSQTKRGHGFVAWQAVVDGFSPNLSSDPAMALQPILATPRRI